MMASDPAPVTPVDPSISVYKGYGSSKETESYLVSHGLRQASFSISASDVQDELFGVLAVCPFQDAGESRQYDLNPPSQPIKLDSYVEPQASAGPACASYSASVWRNEKHNPGESSRSALNPPNQPLKLENYVDTQASAGPACASIPASSRRNAKHDAGASCQSALNPSNQPIKLENYVEPQTSLNTGLNIFPTNSQQNCDVLKNVKPINQIHPSCASGPS